MGSDELINKHSKRTPPDPLRANQMVELWASSPNNWEEIAMGQARELALKQAHELANQGYFVVVGWKNPDSKKSGHVAVVVPGKLQDSGWKCKQVPMTMDTGEGHRWASGRLSEGFGTAKEDSVKFYRYKGPVNK